MNNLYCVVDELGEEKREQREQDGSFYNYSIRI